MEIKITGTEKKLFSCSCKNNQAIERGFPCIPTIKESEGEGGGLPTVGECLFDIMTWGVGTYWEEGTYFSVGA